jgi:type I restriction enzyme S subunit
MSTTISSNWRSTKIKFISKVISGGTPQSANPNYWDGPVPWLTPIDLGKKGSASIGSSGRTITHDGVSEAGLDILPLGSVIISTRAPIGSVGLITCEATTNQGCKAIVPNQGKLDSKFAYYFALDAAEELRSLGVGTTFVELATYSLKNLKLELPPYALQHRFVTYLDEQTAKIDRLMNMRRRQMALLKEQRAALIQQAVTRGLNPNAPMKDSGLPWIGNVPAHWEVKEIRRLVPQSRRVMYGIVLPGPNVDEGVPIVKAGNCEPGRLSIECMHRTTFEIEAEYARSRLRAGDIVYAIRGSFGEAEIVPPELEGANLTQDAARIAPKIGIHNRWLWYAVRSQAFFAQMDSVAVGATIRGVNIRDLKRGKLAVPPISEQKQIAKFIDSESAKFDAIHAAYIHQLKLLTEYRAALIHECVTGQRRIGADLIPELP